MSLLRMLFGKKRGVRRRATPARSAAGKHYDLQAIFDEVNQAYFSGELKLPIYWSGSASQGAQYRRRLGAYNQRRQDIRIHRLLDSPRFPPYFISFIVYHEMLHHLYPPVRGKRGRRQIHHSLFKEKERAFKHYHQAIAWEKENPKEFFYGRT